MSSSVPGQRARVIPLAYHVVHRKESGMHQVRVGLLAALACGLGIKKYSATGALQYRPQLLTRVGYVDLNALTAKVEHDIALAKGE